MTGESVFPYSLLVYAIADGRAGSPIAPLDLPVFAQLRGLSLVLSTPRLAGAYQVDPSNGSTVRDVFLPPNHPARGRYRRELGETNSADIGVLTDFVSWAQENIPAKNIILVLSSHGLAWQDRVVSDALATRGVLTHISRNPSDAITHPKRLFMNRKVAYEAAAAILIDGTTRGLSSRVVDDTKAVLLDGSSSDFVSVAELNSALTSITSVLQQKLTVLVLDACLMSSVEHVYEVAEFAEALVGSIDELSSSGLNTSQAAQRIDSLLQSDGVNATSLAKSFVDTYQPVQVYDSCIAVSCDAAKWSKFTDSFRSFVAKCEAVFTSDGAPSKTAFLNALRQAKLLKKYRAGSLSDFGLLNRSFREVAGGFNTDAIDLLDKSASALRECVIAKASGADYASADIIGMSVFCPISIEDLAYNSFDYNQLKLANTTGWLRLLRTAFET